MKGPNKSPDFGTFICSGRNLRNSSCHFPNNMSVFLRTLHHSSVSWKITHLQFLGQTLYTLHERDQPKCKFLRLLKVLRFLRPLQKTKSFTLMGYFCPKYMSFDLKKYRRVMFRVTEQWCKIWINSDLVASKMAWEIGWTFIIALKNLKNYTLMGSFCPKHIMFQLECFRENIYHETEGWCKI